MKKLIALAAICGLGFCVANAQTSPSTNVATPSNLNTTGTPVMKHAATGVRTTAPASGNLTTTTTPLKKQGSATRKPVIKKMAGNVGAPVAKPSKAGANGANKMQTGTAPMQK